MSQSQQQDPLIGAQMGDYRIEGVLGTGGMARVYRGYDEKLERYAAIKVIEPRLIASDEEEEYRERFLREARAIARLNHGRIVRVYQFGQYDNLYYIAMEYIEGRNLREIVKGYQKQALQMPHDEAVRILRDVAEALDSAHRHNIIHRDVKPSNIIVNSEGNGILTDFGLALNSLEGTIGNTFGSVHYIAPEQAISSAQAVPQSDQYSLAIIAYELFSGRVPFDDASAMSVALKHISDLPPPLHDMLPDFPLDAEVVILKALDKDATRRYGSCAEFVSALADALRMSDAQRFATSSSRPRPSLPRPIPSLDEEWPTYQPMPDSKTQSMGKRGSVPDTMAQTRRRRLAWMGTGIGLAFLVGALILIPTLTPPVNEGATGTAVAREGFSTATQEARIATAIALTSDMRVSQTSAAQETSVFAVFATQTADERLAQAVEATSSARITRTAAAQDTQQAIQQATGFVTATAQALENRTSTAVALVATQNAGATSTAKALATDTPTPTSTPSPTQATPTPSATNTPTPTNTPVPTSTPTPTPTPGLTMIDEMDAPLMLNYDGRALVLYNRNTSSISVNDLEDLEFWLFEPNEEGVITQTGVYKASDWNTSSRLSSQNCLLLYITRFRSFEENESPADICRTVSAFRSTRNTFWLSSGWNAGAYFEVRRGPVDVIVTCPVSEPETRRIKRCLIPMG